MHLEKDFGMRLAAARVISGIAIRVDAADLLNVSQYALMRYEAGTSNPDQALVDGAAALYQVSKDFLELGDVSTDRDQMAYRVSVVLAAVEDGESVDPGRADRLKLARIEAGFATAAAAARKLEFAKATYLAHESGGRRLPVEKAIHYALYLKVRSEYVLTGEGAIRITSSDPMVKWQPLPIEKAERTPKDWQWLGKRGDRGQLVIPVLEMRSNTAGRIGRDSITLPEAILPSALKGLKQPVYAMRSPSGEIWVLDPAKTVGDVAILSKSGPVSARGVKQESLPDIISSAPKSWIGSTLGLIVARISIQSAA